MNNSSLPSQYVTRAELQQSLEEWSQHIVESIMVGMNRWMATVDQRFDRIEICLDRVEARIDKLEKRVDLGFKTINRRLAAIDTRFEQTDSSIEELKIQT